MNLLKYTWSFALLMCINISIQSQSFVLDKVVAKVGSEFILLSEVENQYAYALTQKLEIDLEDEDMKCQILDNLIAQKLIIYQAKLDSVEVSDLEVDAQLDLRFDNILRQMNGDEAFFAEYYGAGVAEMKERYRDDQKQQILAERMQGQLINSVTITPEEVKEFYDAIPKDSLPYLDSEVELGELIIKPEVNEEQKKISKDKLTDIRNQIMSGEKSFEEMALKYSMDPGSGARGGDLGWAKRGTYVPEFEATLFGLKADEISDVIETEFGYHIIKHEERRGNDIRGRHILIRPDLTETDLQNAREKLERIRNLIASDSLNFETAVKRFSDKKSLSYNNNGRIKNRATGNNFFRTDELDPDVYFEIIDLKKGDLTGVIQDKDFGGDIQFRVLQLQSITKPHKANLKQDYDKISQYAKESKKAEYFNEWILDKLENTFIEVRPLYGFCENLKQYVKEDANSSPSEIKP